MSEENLEIRKKVFTNWINEKVGERDKKLKITKDKLSKGAFADGTLLATLYEVVSGTSLNGINTKPKSREDKVKNVSVVFDAMRKRSYVEATVDSIIDSNEVKTLDTIWRLFALFELKRPGLKPSEGTAEMVQWLAGSGFDVADLTKRNAILLITLVNTIRSDLIPLKAMTKDAKKNAQKAIDTAAADLAIPALIEGSDFICDEPDYISNFMYLSYFKANHPTLKTQTVTASALSETSATTQSESTKKNDSDEEAPKEAATKEDKEESSKASSKGEEKDGSRTKKVERTKSSEKTMGKNAPRSKSAPRLKRVISTQDEPSKSTEEASSSKGDSSPKKKMTSSNSSHSKQPSAQEKPKVEDAPAVKEEPKVAEPKEEVPKAERSPKKERRHRDEHKEEKPKADERTDETEADAASDASNHSPSKARAPLTKGLSRSATGSTGAIISPRSSNTIISKLRHNNEERRSLSGDVDGIKLDQAPEEAGEEADEPKAKTKTDDADKEKEKPRERKHKSEKRKSAEQ